MVTAATILGVGLGGFFDGVLFHQLLQVHSMLSARVPKTSVSNLEVNMFWDGVFHTFTWCTTLLGVILLWRAGAHRVAHWSRKGFFGGLFLGWGLFNFIEGVIDHYVLNLRHVLQSHGQSAFDAAFVGSGIVFAFCGWLAIRSAARDLIHEAAH